MDCIVAIALDNNNAYLSAALVSLLIVRANFSDDGIIAKNSTRNY